MVGERGHMDYFVVVVGLPSVNGIASPGGGVDRVETDEPCLTGGCEKHG